ncbi:MAG TPA: ATP-binding protein [Verrucomicrobiae bacterium]|nr:ATP-binding protein [Verrucomicrobiae bacterium]
MNFDNAGLAGFARKRRPDMQAQAEDPVREVKRLKRCINDLVSLLALPAVWSGTEPPQIVDVLLDALLRMLRLDFIYARLEESVAAAPVEFLRIGDSCKVNLESQEIQLALGNWFDSGTQVSLSPARHRFDDVDISIFPLPLGVHGGMGVIVVGSERADFPAQTESLLLSVAANQASFALQEAQLLSEQRQVSSELDHRVAQRTIELANANEELRKEIDERKKIEDRLRESEASLAQAQYLSRTGSFSWKVANDEISWSEQLYRIFDFEPGTPVTIERINSRVYPDDLPAMIERVARARGSGGTLEYEHRLLMADGSVKYLMAIAQENPTAHGKLEYIGAVQDVTQRRFSEDALAKARSELANVARATSLGVLTASVAHEVNQPLSGIITNASTCLRMLDSNPPNLEGARETARRTIRDGRRASDVITRLRTLYSKKDPTLEAMDLNEAAREVLTLSSAEIQKNGVTLRQEFADGLPPALGDRIQLQQVILNLLRNAADAMNTINDRPRELLIRTQRDDRNQLRLSVKDSGVGLSPQVAGKIFEAFYTTKSDGMGIGLSVSRSIIEAHQGRLWATANDGHGTTFSFAIPCAVQASADPQSRLNQADSSMDAA